MIYLLQSNLWQKLGQFDQWLFVKINNSLANPFFDGLMPFLRNSSNWAPLYVFLFVFVLLNFKWNGLWWTLFFTATIALADMCGTYVFKHNFKRMRPCNDPDFFSQVRLVVDYCSGGFGFVSNHAANHFGMATFFFITLKPVIGKWALIGFLWAGLIAFAQVYVGVHYPFDILAGSLLGVGFGVLTGSLFNKRFGFAIFGNQPTLSS
jgi:membrane-associated phospholipid phosphatase